MLKSYFKTAWRNIIRHKTYTVINVFGLGLGICACIVIYLIVSYEFSFDRFHPDGDRIYRIVGELKLVDGEKIFLNSIVPEIAGIENDIPGFEAKAGIHYYYGTVKIQDQNGVNKIFDSGNDVIITWPDYFKIFKYKWLAGDETTALKKPYQLVLTKSKALKYFGKEPLDKIIGKTVVYNDSLEVRVSGIVKDWTENSDLSFKDFISISTVTNSFLKKTIPTDDWRSLSPHRSMVFVKLNEQTTASKIDAQLSDYIKDHTKPSNFGTLEELKLQPLSAIHFSNEFHRGDDGDDFRKANLPTLYALMGLAFFILLIAAFNFINLSTAISFQRSKEVGIRKVLGSSRKKVILQFLLETALLTFIAICTGVWLTEPIIHMFSSYIPSGVSFDFFNVSNIIFLLVLLVSVSILAGIYPSIALSNNLPVESLKGSIISGGKSRSKLRVGLVVFQFALSLLFIIGAIVITKQVGFMYNLDRGFNSHGIITIFNWGDRSGKMKILRDNIKQITGVKNAILEGTPPMGFASSFNVFKYKGKHEIEIQAEIKMGNDDFIPFYGMKILYGRNISHSDSLNELVINEECARTMGFNKAENALGKFLFSNDNKPFPIVGVVADFQTSSYRQPIKPVVIGNMPQRETNLALKISKGENESDINTVISQIEKEWKSLYPKTGFNYIFLDQYIGGLFEKEQQTGWLVTVAMIITIFISCMGLFGLAMFTTEKRTKEIGIRKTMGASTAGIIFLLTKEFAKWVLIANIAAWPIAYYVMNNWLKDFAYKTNISLWIFIFSGLIALITALLTVSYHAIKAARANPVNSLRYE